MNKLKRSIGDICNITGGRLFGCNIQDEVGKFAVNDKSAEKGCVYVSIDGRKHKGNDFADSAYKNGASLIITSEMPKSKLPVLLVKDTRRALLDIAAFYRKRERKTVIAVTGSVGKTTTKELCHAVMSEYTPTLKTQGNKNNTVGLPLTLLSDTAEDIAVIEAGISEIGEMGVLSRAAVPDIAIITGIGHMHAQTLGSRENIAHEKIKILEYANPDCVLIAPEAEPLLMGKHKQTVSVAIESETADFSACNIYYMANGSRFDVKKRNKEYIKEVFVPIIGEHGVMDALFAIAVGELFGLSSQSIKTGLSKYKSAENRQNIMVKSGITVMSDCYNFGPESASAALSAFKILAEKINASKTVLMLGSMLELGRESEGMHLSLGKELACMGFDALITLGTLAKNIALGALIRGMENVYDYDENERVAAGQKLCELAKKGSAVLIKGSRKMEMEEFTSLIISE